MSDPLPKPSKPAPYSDIDLNRWREYEHVLTDSLWLFPNRSRGDGHQLDYHGNFIPQIATRLFSRYTRPDEVIVDFFLGSGTSALEALNLGRRCIGVELKADLLTYVHDKLPPAARDSQVILLEGNSADPVIVPQVKAALQTWGRDAADFVMLHSMLTFKPAA